MTNLIALVLVLVGPVNAQDTLTNAYQNLSRQIPPQKAKLQDEALEEAVATNNQRGKDLALIRAAIGCQLKKAQEALDAGASPNYRHIIKSQYINTEETALHIAAVWCGVSRFDQNPEPERINAEQFLNLLIDRGANIEAHDHKGRTPLFGAVKENNAVATKLLVKRRANVNAKTPGGETPLHTAAWAGNAECVQYLIKNKADISAVMAETDGPQGTKIKGTPRELAVIADTFCPEKHCPEHQQAISFLNDAEKATVKQP